MNPYTITLMNVLIKRIHIHIQAQTDEHSHKYTMALTQKTIIVDNLKNTL